MSSGGQTCWECGTVLKPGAIMNSHVGTRPCQLAKTEREMDRRGWALCDAFDATEVLNETEVEYERGPSRYTSGEMVRIDFKARVGATPKVPLKPHFKKPVLGTGIWCPAWAQWIVDLTLLRKIRVRLLQWVNGDAERVAAMKTALALGGLEAVVAMVGVAVLDIEEGDDANDW